MKKYSRLSYEERVKIATLLKLKWSYEKVAQELGRNKSTISRELKRTGAYSYFPETAHLLAQEKSRNHCTGKKIDEYMPLKRFVFSKLKKRWSPKQISVELQRKFSDNPRMQISHESIYSYIYVLPRGSLRKELISYLRQEKKLRNKRTGKNEKRGKIPEMISIEERPSEVASRSVPGHWEGDLILGKAHKTAIGTIVERKTRTVIIVPLKAKDAQSVRLAFEKELKKIPAQMRLTLTYDQGHEMTQHKLFGKNTNMKVYFCHPASPWERGTCENTNMLIRDYFPKGTDFSKISRRELKRVQRELNERPRKTLGYRTPLEVFNEEVLNLLR